MTAVAEPTGVAFALPVDGPIAIVEPARANFATEPITEPKPIVAPPVQVLTYGQGEGRQPAPEYPLRARREGQEGAVRIRFSVGEDGRVLAAEAVNPSPWKLLNDAAVRVVQERWRFSQGAVRLYEVSIRFQLTK
jgi:periplasmic protein TonB